MVHDARSALKIFEKGLTIQYNDFRWVSLEAITDFCLDKSTTEISTLHKLKI